MLIGYSRVSTDDQKQDLQIDALRAAGCEHILEEVASGAKVDRPVLHEALKYARTGDVLVVWRLDRLARSLGQLLETIDTLQERGIGFQSLTEAIDTNSAGGRLVFSVFGAVAEFERNLIRERTVAGLEAARRKGRVGGRPKSLDESDLVYARTLLANPEIPVSEIAERLCVSPSTLYRYLPPGGRSAVLAGE